MIPANMQETPMRYHITLLALTTFATTTLAQPTYPDARRDGTVDNYHGTRVADPYRWLENETSDETQSWIAAQNEITNAYLDSLPARDRIEARLTELYNYERFGTPEEEGGRYFYSRNDGLQNQSVLYVADSLDATPRVLIDPNTFSEDGTQALGGTEVSPNGKLLAYAVSDGGSDWRIWRVRDIDSGRDLADTLRHIKFSGVSWESDNSAFYYSRYPLGDDGNADDQQAVAVYRHELGTSQDADTLVYEAEVETHNPYATVTDDGQFLIVSHFDGYLANAVYFKRIGEPNAQVTPLFDKWDGQYNFLGNTGDTMFFTTTKDAPNSRIIAVNAAAPDRVREIIPEQDQALQGVSLVGGHLIAQFIEDAKSAIRIYNLDGVLVREVSLPGVGTAGGFGGHADKSETFYSFSGFTQPGAIYRYDAATGESELFRQPQVLFDLNKFETKQVFYKSKDGTRVPMFLVHKKGLSLDGSNPTLLYGYGGFNISLTPSFRASRLAWVEMGGVYAVANLRGGGEYGEAWHIDGTKANKQNVFDDFIAAAEWLIDEGYTSTPKLAIQGGSNGGLLVGACMTQRPDLFGACLPAVGVLDMLRYHTQSANARQWSDDFGLSEDPDGFHYLWAYSPLHNVRVGACYPPTLITTAEGDDRVKPWHSYKFAAALQRGQDCDNPTLIRIETRAGHGAGKPLSKSIRETADIYAFLVDQLDMHLP
jgi:prolyl oligopeptidase